MPSEKARSCLHGVPWRALWQTSGLRLYGMPGNLHRKNQILGLETVAGRIHCCTASLTACLDRYTLGRFARPTIYAYLRVYTRQEQRDPITAQPMV